MRNSAVGEFKDFKILPALEILSKSKKFLKPKSPSFDFYDYGGISYITELNYRLGYSSCDPETILKKSLDFLIDNSYFIKNCVFTFSGKPLRYIKLLNKFVKYSKRTASRFKKNISFRLITDELIYNQEVIRFINNSHAFLIYCLSNYNLVTKNFLAAKFLRNIHIYPKIIIPLKTRKIIKLSDTLLKQGWRNFHFQIPPKLKEGELVYFKDFYETLMDWYLEKIRNGTIFNIIEFSENLFRPHSKRFKCNYGINALSILPDGEIIPCPGFEIKEFSLGNILHGRLDKIKRARFFCLSVEEKQSCKDCWAKPYCGGGCNLHTYRNTNSLKEISKEHCILYKHIIKLSLFLLFKIKGIDKNILRELFFLLEGSSFKNCY